MESVPMPSIPFAGWRTLPLVMIITLFAFIIQQFLSPTLALFIWSFLVCHIAVPRACPALVRAGRLGRDLHRPCTEQNPPPKLEIIQDSHKVTVLQAPIQGTPVPESAGLIAGATYLVALVLYLPFVSHSKLIVMLSALLSMTAMLLLGFVDDALDLPWRHKLTLPTIASLPLLMVYAVTGGLTTVLLPWGVLMDLSIFYYLYMSLLAVFCTNSINILAGINGLETGQSLILALGVILHSILQMLTMPNLYQNYELSVTLLLPFAGVTLALYRYNRYPAQVFVGDTFCYFAGMCFACTGILCHFSKTMVLFFSPQIFNFLMSLPQLAHIIPCPRHRLPLYHPETRLLEPSRVLVNYSQSNWRTKGIIVLLESVKLAWPKEKKEKEDKQYWVVNLTLLNLILVWRGAMSEKALTHWLLYLQCIGAGVALFIRYGLVRLFYVE